MSRERRTTTGWPAGLQGLAFLFLSAASGLVTAQGIQFRSAGEGVVVRDAPSPQGRQLFALRAGTPLEVIVVQDGWVRVREPGGTLNWVEERTLVPRRTVMVSVDRATIRREAREQAAPSFEAVRNVVLDLIEPAALGWARVRHRDGLEGYVRVNEVWGL